MNDKVHQNLINPEKEHNDNDKEEKKRKKILKFFFELIIYVIIFATIIYGVPFVLKKALNTPYPIASVTSNSMWPVLEKGDIVFIQGLDRQDNIKTGDVVVYENKKGFTIHRVVSVGKETFITKGDANNIQDEPVSYEKVIGKAVEIGDKKLFKIPWIGKISLIINK